MTQAIRYHRFSSKAQEKGSSLDRQDKATKALCENHGWEAVETLEDLGRSAWRGDHLRVGHLGKFRKRVDAGEFAPGTVLVVENLDRLSRQDGLTARRWVEDVIIAGITVAVYKPELLLDKAAMSGANFGALVQYLLEQDRGHKEGNRKSDLLLEAWVADRESAKQGRIITKQCPGWLATTGEKVRKFGINTYQFNVIEERAEVVRQIYRWSVEGLGATGICHKLNGQGILCWGRNQHKFFDSQWKPGYVRDVLVSPAVEGEYHPGTKQGKTGDRIEGYYPRIVDADLVARARAARLRRSKTGGATHEEAKNLFAGRVRCHHCNNTMVRVVQYNARGKRYEYLKCQGYNVGSPCPNKTLYDYSAFERDALEQMLHLALDDTHFARVDETASLAVRLAEAEKALENKRAEQTRLVRILARLDDAPEIETELGSIRAEIVQLEDKRQRADAALKRARGAVSPDEHLKRVLEVRDAIYSTDDETRTAARRKVRDAIHSIVTLIECRMDDPIADKRKGRFPGKTLTMILAGGFMAYKFAHRGGLLSKLDLHNQPAMQAGIRGTGGEAAMADIKRRRAA